MEVLDKVQLNKEAASFYNRDSQVTSTVGNKNKIINGELQPYLAQFSAHDSELSPAYTAM